MSAIDAGPHPFFKWVHSGVGGSEIHKEIREDPGLQPIGMLPHSILKCLHWISKLLSWSEVSLESSPWKIENQILTTVCIKNRNL